MRTGYWTHKMRSQTVASIMTTQRTRLFPAPDHDLTPDPGLEYRVPKGIRSKIRIRSRSDWYLTWPVAILASFTISSSLPAEAEPVEALTEKAIEEIAEAVVPEMLRERKIPGAAVAVLSGDTVLFAKGYGVADLEKQTPVTTATVFQLASTTKPFTAAVIMRLLEEKKLSLDERS